MRWQTNCRAAKRQTCCSTHVNKQRCAKQRTVRARVENKANASQPPACHVTRMKHNVTPPQRCRGAYAAQQRVARAHQPGTAQQQRSSATNKVFDYAQSPAQKRATPHKTTKMQDRSQYWRHRTNAYSKMFATIPSVTTGSAFAFCNTRYQYGMQSPKIANRAVLTQTVTYRNNDAARRTAAVPQNVIKQRVRT